MRISILLLTVCVPVSAMADDFDLRATATAATLHPNGTVIQMSAPVTLPAGQHRLFLPRGIDGDGRAAEGVFARGGYRDDPLPEFKLDGADIRSVRFLDAVAWSQGRSETPPEALARAAAQTAKSRLADAQERLERLDAQIAAETAKLGFLENLGATEIKDAAALTTVFTQIGQLHGTSGVSVVSLKRQRADMADSLTALKLAHLTAKRDHAALRPLGDVVQGWALEVTAKAPVTGALTYKAYEADLAWSMAHSLDLTTGPQPALAVSSQIEVRNRSLRYLPDLPVTFTTQDLGSGTPQVSKNLARIALPPPPQPMGRLDAPQPMMEAPVVVEESAGGFQEFGFNVTLTHPDPITLTRDINEVLLSADNHQLTPEVALIAYPHRETRAHLLARLKGDGSRRIIPGDALMHRDGVLVRDGTFALAPNGEAEVFFGEVPTIELSKERAQREDGASGVIQTSRTREETFIYRLKNTGTKPETVEVYIPVPISQQQDLQIDYRLSPRPTSRDVKGEGIHRWDVDLAPGIDTSIQITVKMAWPEGYDLDWWP